METTKETERIEETDGKKGEGVNEGRSQRGKEYTGGRKIKKNTGIDEMDGRKDEGRKGGRERQVKA